MARGKRSGQAIDSHYGASYTSVMEFAVWLIGEARSRQRRRRRRLAWLGVVLVVLSIVVRAEFESVQPPRQASRASRGSLVADVPPSAVLAKDPYMGVRCPQPNSISCDRVGLAVWLRHPAVHVTGTIAGQPLTLDWFGDQRHVGPVPARSELDGYLQPAHLTTLLGVRPDPPGLWFCCSADQPSPRVTLWITFADGSRVRTELQVPLSPGWG